jgi:hypothetical protein
MPKEEQKAPATPGSRYSWRRVLNLALLTGSAAATLIALTLVGALLWWLYAPSTQEPTAAASRLPAPPLAAAEPAPEPAAAAAVAAPPAPAPASKRPASNYSVRAGAPPAPTPAEPPRRRVYKRTEDGDAERNRAIAQGLQQLGRDPEAVRQLGIPDQSPTQ